MPLISHVLNHRTLVTPILWNYSLVDVEDPQLINVRFSVQRLVAYLQASGRPAPSKIFSFSNNDPFEICLEALNETHALPLWDQLATKMPEADVVQVVYLYMSSAHTLTHIDFVGFLLTYLLTQVVERGLNKLRVQAKSPLLTLAASQVVSQLVT